MVERSVLEMVVAVLTICFVGYLMASRRAGVLQPGGARRVLNGFVFSLLLPCLIFAQLDRAITLQKLMQWWFIPVNIVLGAVFASLIGLAVASIIRPPYPYFKFTVVHIGIGNIGNIPLVLISALCRDQSNPIGDPNECNQDGNAYISFGQWVGAIIVYTYVFKMLHHQERPLTAATRRKSDFQLRLLVRMLCVAVLYMRKNLCYLRRWRSRKTLFPL